MSDQDDLSGHDKLRRKAAEWLAVFFAMLVVAACAVYVLSQAMPTDPAQKVTLALASAFGMVTVLALAALAAAIIGKMVTGTIDLRYLVADDDKMASLSRFQMLLFTFVIAALYFIYALYWLGASKSGVACQVSVDAALSLKAVGDALKGVNASGDAAVQAASAAVQAAQAKMAACATWGLPDIPNSVLGLIGISGGSYLLSKGIQLAGKPATPAAPPPPQ